MNSHTRHIVTAGVVLGVLAVGAGIFIWSGLYNIGADAPHWRPTLAVIEKMRERSIASRMADAQVPNLEDPKRIATGAVNYSAMCTGCHLAPGVADTELRPGLYPMPPDLTKAGSEDDKRTFWIIKHGIKMTAMPAWGKTHTDEQIWNMVAFIRKLPGMTPEQYAALGGKPPAEDEDHMHAGGEESGDGHSHAGGEEPGAMAGMDMSGGTQPAGHEHADPAQSGHSHPDAAAPSMQGLTAKAAPDAEAAAQAFHAALKKGDRDAVKALLAADVSISEGGESQSREQYMGAHLSGDIAFLKAAQIKPLSLASMPMGDTAMVGSKSEIRSSHDGKPLALLSTEMLTMKKTAAGWQIVKIVWASDKLPQ